MLGRALIPHRSMRDKVLLLAIALAPLAILAVAFALPRFLGLALLQAWLLVTLLSHHDKEAAAQLHCVLTLPWIAGFFCAHLIFALPTLNTVPAFYDTLPGALLDAGEWVN